MNNLKCSVVIPVKNAVRILPEVIDRVLSQKTEWPFEVIVIDSGSQDGTAEYLRNLDTVRLIEISPSDFGHGRTRNLGVSISSSQFVAFLTHDAVPKDDFWLANLVAVAETDTQIAGVFGRHVARDDASPYTKYDLDRHFDGFGKLPLVHSRALDEALYETEQGWRQIMHFYSDNNSLMRRSVWETIPYPDVEFAEDQLWARAVIEAGYKKAYCADAVVIHSHDYGLREQFSRAFDESRNFRKYFGYLLSPTPFHLFEAIYRFTIEAFSQDLDPRYGKLRRRDRLRRALQRSMLVAGHCAGANHEIFPAWLARRMSLDEKLFRS
jgi:rhamnosyltransferase